MKKIIPILFLVTSLFCCAQKNNSPIEWKTFSNEIYSIKYPSNWKVKGGKLSLMTGKKASFVDREWTFIMTDANNKERIEFFFDIENDCKDYKMVKKPIVIDSIKGFYYLCTKDKEYIETVLLKTKNTWFKFDNNEVKDENFKGFYSSFNYKKN
ncbi:MAG: hypothetical protein AB8B78_04895 [Polaribacter sp.]